MSTKTLELCNENSENIQKNNSTQKSIDSITRISINKLDYNDFFKDHMFPNIPIILTEVSTNWECKNWINDKNQINFEYLKEKISNIKVPVANCSVKYLNSHEKGELNFYDFLDYWKTGDYENNLFYLKDWHLKNLMPKYDFYETPIYFVSDWLNEYLIDSGQDDYRFVYMGPKGSWTPLHSDVFSSFSWSTNIFGRKKWIFFPPGEETKLFDKFGNLPFSISNSDLKNLKHFEVIQNPGEAIFVPSDWHHQVWNLDDTISINHNWFNGCNIFLVWRTLFENFEKVVKEISDCKDMDNFVEHCQVMLKASFGMNFKDLLDLLEHISDKRIKLLKDEKTFNFFKDFQLNRNHIIFDLKSIEMVLTDFLTKDLNLNDRILNILETILFTQ